MVNFGPLTTKLCLLILTYPASTVRAFSNNFRIWPRISLDWIKISTSGKCCFQLRYIPKYKKFGGLGFTNHKFVFAHFDLPNIDSLHFFKHFRLWSHISWEWIEISIKGKRRLQPWSISRRTQKNWWSWVYKEKSSVVSFRTTQV